MRPPCQRHHLELVVADREPLTTGQRQSPTPAQRLAIDPAVIEEALLSDGCIISSATIRRSIIGVRSVIESGCEITDSIIIGSDYYNKVWFVDGQETSKPILIGAGTKIHRAIIDKNVRIGDNVSILQGVTLGGTGKSEEDRHPKIGNGVLIGAGAKVLGNITVGDYAKVASGSVVLKAVPSGCTVAGVPARLVNCPTNAEPARTMDHTLAEVVYDFVI